MKKENVPAAVPAKDYLLNRLQDPATAAAYLNAAVEEDDPGAFLQALRNVTEARGGVARVADLTGLNRQQLYRTLSENGNPELRSLSKILGVSGLRFAVVAKSASAASAPKSRKLAQKRVRLSPSAKMARAA
jgi:probable addiction module antidote protein